MVMVITLNKILKREKVRIDLNPWMQEIKKEFTNVDSFFISPVFSIGTPYKKIDDFIKLRLIIIHFQEN